MEFLQNHKNKILIAAAAATVSGVLLAFKNSVGSLSDKISNAISEFESKSSTTNRKSTLLTTLRQVLSQLIAKPDRIESGFSEFLLTSFQIFDAKLTQLPPQAYIDEDLLATHQDIMSAVLTVLSEALTAHKILVDALPDILLKNMLKEKTDYMNFFFTSMPYIRESEAINFFNAHFISSPALKNQFLSKLIVHAYSLLHITTQTVEVQGDEPISNTSFFFSCYFPLISEESFLSTLDPACFLSSVVLYNHFLTSFNNNLELFTFRETFLLEWSRLLSRVISSPTFVKNAANATEVAIFPEIFQQLVHQLLTFQVSYTLQDGEIPQYWEIYQKRLIPYCSVMILVEESLKQIDTFLLNIKRAGLNILKYKTAFMTIIHDFSLSIQQFYAKSNASNFHDLLKSATTLMIVHCSQTRLPSSASIAAFWETMFLPKDCSKQFLQVQYFKANIAPLFDITGMSKLVEMNEEFYRGDAKKHIKIFLQLQNNKKSLYNRLRVIGYQVAVLSPEFEDKDVQINIVSRLFKETGDIDTNAVMANVLNISEKIFTPLHIINQTIATHGSAKNEENELIHEELRKQTLNGLHYLTNVFKLGGQNLSKQEALTYLKNGIYSEIQLESLDEFLESSSEPSIVLKSAETLPRCNLLELFFDKQMCFEGFSGAHLSQDISQPLYDSLDSVKEVQYRLFTKTFFVNYVEKSVFKNKEVTSQMLPNLLVFFELYIDFIFQSHMDGEPDLNIAVLRERLCTNTEMIDALVAARADFDEKNPNAVAFNEQLLKRINARLDQIKVLPQQ